MIRKDAVTCIFISMMITGVSMGKDQKTTTEEELQSSKTPDVLLPDVLGSTHVTGRYYHTKKDYLNEGVDEVLAMGSRVIKLWFYAKRHEHPHAVYPFNSDWEEVDNLVEGAKLPYWKVVFDKPFTSYILCVTSFGRHDGYWVDGVSQKDARDEMRQFYELTKHFLTTYKNTGKTFVFQHWEGDWMTRARNENQFDENVPPSQFVFDNMIKWLNARQAGVNKAREEFGEEGVRVLHAAEVNRVVTSMLEGKPNMVNKVIPFTNVDLVSYSAYDSTFSILEGKEDLFGSAIDFIKQNLPPSAAFGDNSVYIGEFGVPENEYTEEQTKKVLPYSVETALNKKCPYIVYWQLYCNESKQGVKVPSWNNEDYRGFWLIRPDGSKTWVWHYFYELLN